MPPGAAILLDGREVGSSDQLLRDVEAGRAEVVVRLSGYREARSRVSLRAGEATLVTFHLEPLPGTLRLRVKGPDQFLLASDDESWKSPKKLELEPGDHRFLVRALGYRDRTVRTRVEPGRETSLEIAMERAPLPSGMIPGGAYPNLPPGMVPGGSYPRMPSGTFNPADLRNLPPLPRMPGGLPRAPGGLPPLSLPTSLPPLSLPTAPAPSRPPQIPGAAVTPVPPPTAPEAVLTPVPPRGGAGTVPESIVTPVNR